MRRGAPRGPPQTGCQSLSMRARSAGDATTAREARRTRAGRYSTDDDDGVRVSVRAPRRRPTRGGPGTRPCTPRCWCRARRDSSPGRTAPVRAVEIVVALDARAVHAPLEDRVGRTAARRKRLAVLGREALDARARLRRRSASGTRTRCRAWRRATRRRSARGQPLRPRPLPCSAPQRGLERSSRRCV